MIINAQNLILGRLASFVAKKALLREKIEIVNCEKAIISGRKKDILAKYRERVERLNPLHGPFMYKKADRFVKKVIKGMLPHKQDKGRKALKNVKCFIGLPEKFKDKKMETIKNANVEKMHNLKYLKVKDVLEFLGG